MLNETLLLRNKKSTMLYTLNAYVYRLYLAYKVQFQNIPFMKHRRTCNYNLNNTKFFLKKITRKKSTGSKKQILNLSNMI